MISRSAVFIDGAYLDWLIAHEPGVPKVKIHELIPHMVGNGDLLRAYWYDCLPAVVGINDKMVLERKERFLEYLKTLPKMEIRLGRMGVSNRGSGMVQKGVDVSLAVDLVALATQGAISQAHLVSGDNDFAPAVRYAKANGVSVKLWYGFKSGPGRELFDSCDEREEIKLADFKAELRTI